MNREPLNHQNIKILFEDVQGLQTLCAFHCDEKFPIDNNEENIYIAYYRGLVKHSR